MIAGTTAIVGEAAFAPLAMAIGTGELAAKKGMGDQLAFEGEGTGRVKANVNPSGKSVTSSMRLQAEKVDVVGETRLGENTRTRPYRRFTPEEINNRINLRAATREELE